LYFELSDNVLRSGHNYMYVCTGCQGHRSWSRMETVVKKRKWQIRWSIIVGFEAFTVNNGIRQSSVMMSLNLTACRDLLYLRQSQKF